MWFGSCIMREIWGSRDKSESWVEFINMVVRVKVQELAILRRASVKIGKRSKSRQFSDCLWRDSRDFCSSIYLRAAQAGKKMGGKNAPVVPRKTIEMGFIAGRGLGLHASTVFFETVWSHLSCLQHLSSHQKFSSVSRQFFFCRWQFTSTSLPAEGRNLYKIHTVFTWILFHITQAGCRPLNAVQRIKAGHSLYQKHAHWHFRGVFFMISNVCSHVPFKSEAFRAEYQHSFLLPLTLPFLHLHCSVTELSEMEVHLHSSICPWHTIKWKCSFSPLYWIICASP